MKKPIIAMSGLKDGNMSFQYNSQRTGSIFETRKNRSCFLDGLGIPENKVFYMDPRHSTRIRQVGNGHLKIRSEYTDIMGITCDGLYTTQKNIALAFTPADCMPIFFWNKKVIALVHAGRKGMAEALPLKMLFMLQEKGLVDAKNPLKIQMGHHIRTCCYKFPVKHFWEWGYKFTNMAPQGGDIFTVSLYWRLKYILANHHILGGGAAMCTCCAKDKKRNFKFFSHTRSNNDRFPGNHPEGRNMAIIMAREEDN